MSLVQPPSFCLHYGDQLPSKPIMELNPPGTPDYLRKFGPVLETADYSNHTCDPEKVKTYRERLKKARQDELWNYQI